MSVAYTLLIGLVVGIVARLLFPGPQRMNWLWTIALGIGGALVAAWGGRMLGFYQDGQPASFVSSVIGALVLLVVYRALTKKS